MRNYGNLYLGNHLDYFGTKFRSMDAKVLSRLFRAKIIQSTTATTSIVCRAIRVHFRHCEATCRRSNPQKIPPPLRSGVRGWVAFPSLRDLRKQVVAIHKIKKWIASLRFVRLAMTAQAIQTQQQRSINVKNILRTFKK